MPTTPSTACQLLGPICCALLLTVPSCVPCPAPCLQKEAALVVQLEAELAAIDKRQGELKKVLYQRFGKSINLADS